MSTRAPACASRREMARPIPLPPPVTRATFPCRDFGAMRSSMAQLWRRDRRDAAGRGRDGFVRKRDGSGAESYGFGTPDL